MRRSRAIGPLCALAAHLAGGEARAAEPAVAPAKAAAIAMAGPLVPSKEADVLAAEIRGALAGRPEIALIPAEREQRLFRTPKPDAPKKQKKNLETAKK